MTADELLQLNLPNKRTELVRGQLIVREPAGFRHGEVGARLAARIVTFVYARHLGHVAAAETGFQIESDPDTVRAPDVAFVRRERLPNPPPIGFPTLAPDLAVEVLSPGDTRKEVREKVTEWLNAGTALVWIVDPATHTARVYRADRTESDIPESGMLDGESVLPGFSLELASIFS